MKDLLETFCSNALLVKMRAINARRLSIKDYDEMLKKIYISDVVQYLSNTHFSEILQGIKKTVERDELESLIKISRILEYKKLLKYINNFSNIFVIYFKLEFEIEQILMILKLFKIGSIEKFAIIHSAELVKHMNLDVKQIIEAKSSSDILDVMSKTCYAKILKSELEFKELKDIDVLSCEKKLKIYFYEYIQTELKKSKSRKKQNMLKKIANCADIYNLELIYRLKKFYNYSSEQIEKLLIPFGNLAGTAKRRNSFYENLKQDYTEIFKNNKLLGSFSMEGKESIETEIDKTTLCEAKKSIKMETYVPIVLWSFINLAKIEQNNLIKIIEGIENKQNPSQIKEMLVC